VAVAQFAGCGITTGDGRLFCWGQNASGLLGINSTDFSARMLEAVEAPTLLRFRALDGGDTHMCALDVGDELYCWGSNSQGQLGLTSVTAALQPTAVQPGTRWQQVSTLYQHTCAVRSDGALFCWGLNENSQLGDGGTTNAMVPTRVGTDSDWTWVSAGVAHTCGIRGVGTGAHLYCWGRNTAGEAGVAPEAPPVPVTVPTEVMPRADWQQVSAGLYHTCVIAGGTGYCFGFGLRGELGDNNLSSSTTPIRVGGPGGPTTGWTSIAASWDYSCGVAGGTPYCWGDPDRVKFAPPNGDGVVPAATEVVLEPAP
jgi:alpha-tubulin suppressor-like RCC1 family protein